MSKDSSRLAWLAAVLAEKRDKIGHLLYRMTGFGIGAELKPAVFRKFLGILDQITEAKAEEMRLINQIEKIEQTHHLQRKNHKLRRADFHHRPSQDFASDMENDVKRPSRSYLWLLAFWYLLMRKEINQKKQRLTVD